MCARARLIALRSLQWQVKRQRIIPVSIELHRSSPDSFVWLYLPHATETERRSATYEGDRENSDSMEWFWTAVECWESEHYRTKPEALFQNCEQWRNRRLILLFRIRSNPCTLFDMHFSHMHFRVELGRSFRRSETLFWTSISWGNAVSKAASASNVDILMHILNRSECTRLISIITNRNSWS